MGLKNIIFGMLNQGRGSREVVRSQISAFLKSGYKNTMVVSTQPSEDLDVNTFTVDIGQRPVPIHDFLPDVGLTKPVYAMDFEEANEYRDLFIKGFHKALAYLNATSEDTIMILHHANIHTVAAHDVSRETSIPYLMQPHGTCIGGYIKSGRVQAYKEGRPEGAVWGAIRNALDDAQGIIAVSDFVRRTHIAPYVSNPSKIKIIPNGIDEESTSRVDPEYVQQLIQQGRIADLPYILQIGEIINQKRPQDLAAASHILPDNIQVLFLGKGDYELMKRVEREGKNCITLGPVYGPKRNALLRDPRTQLLAVSSFDEAFGLTPLEAATTGVPAVVRPSGALPEIIQDGLNGFVARDLSVEAYAEALQRGLKTSPQLIGEFLSKYTLERFGPTNTSFKVIELAESTLQMESEIRHESKRERTDGSLPRQSRR